MYIQYRPWIFLIFTVAFLIRYVQSIIKEEKRPLELILDAFLGLALIGITLKFFVVGPRIIRWYLLDFCCCPLGAKAYFDLFGKKDGMIESKIAAARVGVWPALTYALVNELLWSKPYDPINANNSQLVRDPLDIVAYIGGLVVVYVILSIKRLQ